MISIKNLYKSFGEKNLFADYSLEIQKGEFLVFSGESGCGKTTMLNMIGWIEPFDKGDIIVNGISLTNRKKRLDFFRYEVGFLFQNFALIENKNVLENLNIIKKQCRTEMSVFEALERIGLADKINEKVYTLSGGEQQRIALARLMLKRSNVILADEPTGSLDKKNAEAVIGILKDLNENGKTIVLVTHDEKIKTMGTRLIEL